MKMIQTISDKSVESDDEDADDGEGEVVALARRALELLGKSPFPPARPGLAEG